MNNVRRTLHETRHRPLRRTLRRGVALAATLSLLLAACGDANAPAADQDAPDLSIAVASFDVHVGDDQRLLAGVFTPDRSLLGFGEVTFQLGHVDPGQPDQVALPQQTTARWLGVPGMEPSGPADAPRLLAGEQGSGVYAARVTLDSPGTWALLVTAEVDGEILEGQTVFTVLEEPLVPNVGDPAPRTGNLTITDVEAGRVAAHAVDSRARAEDQTIPDLHLHDTVIADALDEGRPVVVVVATPVYCVSRFCGPLTEVIADVADRHADRAAFVHLEVWHDFDEGELNDAAAAWIQTEIGGNEPWVFLVGSDGTIVARWDNVLDVEALEDELASL
ncbi:MAG: hypothetical protein WD575_04780 [Nitriliruptoraceae bacterium]